MNLGEQAQDVFVQGQTVGNVVSDRGETFCAPLGRLVGGRWEDFRTAKRVKDLVARWEEILRQNGAECFERLQAPLTWL